jgi:hypothetical protein
LTNTDTAGPRAIFPLATARESGSAVRTYPSHSQPESSRNPGLLSRTGCEPTRRTEFRTRSAESRETLQVSDCDGANRASHPSHSRFAPARRTNAAVGGRISPYGGFAISRRAFLLLTTGLRRRSAARPAAVAPPAAIDRRPAASLCTSRCASIASSTVSFPAR